MTAPVMTTPRPCTVTPCADRHYSLGLCRTHYERLRKRGDVGSPERMKARWGEGNRRSDGYTKINQPDHPLAASDGRVYAHRRALYAQIGPGSHPCHWCGRMVDWLGRSWTELLVVDHRDFDRTNDAPGNLAPACHSCNSGRTARWQ